MPHGSSCTTCQEGGFQLEKYLQPDAIPIPTDKKTQDHSTASSMEQFPPYIEEMAMAMVAAGKTLSIGGVNLDTRQAGSHANQGPLSDGMKSAPETYETRRFNRLLAYREAEYKSQFTSIPSDVDSDTLFRLHADFARMGFDTLGYAEAKVAMIEKWLNEVEPVPGFQIGHNSHPVADSLWHGASSAAPGEASTSFLKRQTFYNDRPLMRCLDDDQPEGELFQRAVSPLTLPPPCVMVREDSSLITNRELIEAIGNTMDMLGVAREDDHKRNPQEVHKFWNNVREQLWGNDGDGNWVAQEASSVYSQNTLSSSWVIVEAPSKISYTSSMERGNIYLGERCPLVPSIYQPTDKELEDLGEQPTKADENGMGAHDSESQEDDLSSSSTGLSGTAGESEEAGLEENN
ncbi:hypothetical protein F4779DRAFT_620378 [Xylariaceae sp. FL0662B]|nr:hypothetical protein F4779DRAFT_620378 [Xylariaceae sp. FL0662B]